MADLKMRISELLKNIYIFKSADIDIISGRIDGLPKEALLKIIKILEEVKVKQDDFLRKMNSENPDFNKDLKAFFNVEYKKAIEGVSKTESDSAEEILTSLDI